jgi:hypothetical protein
MGEGSITWAGIAVSKAFSKGGQNPTGLVGRWGGCAGDPT